MHDNNHMHLPGEEKYNDHQCEPDSPKGRCNEQTTFSDCSHWQGGFVTVMKMVNILTREIFPYNNCIQTEGQS